jgi:hypothetical protein
MAYNEKGFEEEGYSSFLPSENSISGIQEKGRRKIKRDSLR